MEEVRRLRLEKGWNQNELAFHADLAPSVISLVETGSRDPNATTLRKLARALGVEIPDLFGRTKAPKATAPLSSGNSPTEGRAPNPVSWTKYINELATDLEEWSFGFHKGDDPANLPESEFLAFVGGASVAEATYRRAKGTVEPLAVQHQDEDLARAWRRLSRVILAMVTPGVERRLDKMEHGELPENVVNLKARVA
jgi:transcriptional regulator with XRE-family HTH domain